MVIKTSAVIRDSVKLGAIKGPIPDKVPNMAIMPAIMFKPVSVNRSSRTETHIKKGVIINARVNRNFG